MIKDKTELETVTIYNPTLKAYQEIALKDMKEQMSSMGLDEKEVKAKVSKILDGKREYLKNMGLDTKIINETLKNYE